MKFFVIFLSAIFILLPFGAYALCSLDGYTVVYVNGILTSQGDANDDTNALQRQFAKKSDLKEVVFHTGYNESHLGGFDDLIASIKQVNSPNFQDHDLTHILIQIHPDVTTRKILLVGHSQGTFYTNEIYKYLTEHGVAKESIAVYNVATPAGFVAGNGNHLTSQNDKVINLVRKHMTSDKQPLPANIDIPLSPEEAANQFGGHSFSGVYLANAPETIVSDVAGALNKLTATNSEQVSSTQDECFVPPDEDFQYLSDGVRYAIDDFTIGGAVKIGVNVYAGAVFAANAAYNGAVLAANAAYDTAVAAANGAKYAVNSVGSAIGSVNNFLTAIISQNFGTGSTSSTGSGQANSPQAGGIARNPLVASMIPLGNNSPSPDAPALSLSETASTTTPAPQLVVSRVEPPPPAQKNKFLNASDSTHLIDSGQANSPQAVQLIEQTPSAGHSTLRVSGSMSSGQASGDILAQTPSAIQNTLVKEASSPTNGGVGGGGGGGVTFGSVSQTPPAVSLPNPPPVSQPSPPPSPPPLPEIVIPSIQNFQAKFSTSTLNIDLSWTPLDVQNSSTTTFVVKNTTNSGSTSLTTSSSTIIVETSSTAATCGELCRTTFTPPDLSLNYDFSIQAFDGSTSLTTSGGTANSTSSWQATSSVSTTTAVVSDYFANVQQIDADESIGSWYSDNWYQLGTGFYGTVYALTFEGYVNGSPYSASHLTLKEFLDSNYSHLNRSFTISDNAPFVATSTKITIKGLNIPLQPNKYYRLDTYQDYQNRSVILKGTTATGTAMWDGFIYGTGIIRHQYPFYPYVQAIMAKNFPPLSAPNPPGSLSASLNTSTLSLDVSWLNSTDSDTPANLLSYQINYSTSSELSSDGWVADTSPTIIKVVPPNSYILRVRALDDFGNTSTPATINWNFP